MKIVFCASEVAGFAKTGGLADVAAALPQALEKLGHELVVITPAYKSTLQDAAVSKKPFKDGCFVSRLGRNVTVYLVGNERFFGRDKLYGDSRGDYADNLERFAFFCRRSLELLREADVRPDILHCHDWQTGLIPVLLRNELANDDFFKHCRSVFTIHNLGYQGIFPREQFPRLGLAPRLFGVHGLEFYDQVNLLKGGLLFSDAITTVSPTYGKEIQAKEQGFGLEGVLRHRSADLHGILNGLDYSLWDPRHDRHIYKRFGPQQLAARAANKDGLQQHCRLIRNQARPLLGIVSRLAQQKGFDLLAQCLESVLRMDVQLAVLGSGEARYEHLFAAAAKKFPRQVFLHSGFDDVLARRIYAGSDIFLMPSQYEPCGLGQMIALKYGSLPLVHKTGGLADTVSEKNGFVFDTYSAAALLRCLRQALAEYGRKTSWSRKVCAAMRCAFPWSQSARHYLSVYEKVRGR